MPEIVVFEFQKNSREKVRAVVREWQGKELIDLRVCYLDKSGEWKPGPKGLCLQSEALPDLKTAVVALEKVLGGGVA
jgi:hypothetical protein